MDQQELFHELMTANQEEQKMTKKQVQIIQAAVEIISEKGYAATSTSEIAKRAGVAEGTIFRHYKTKKDLLISIVTPVIQRFMIPFFADQFVQEIFKDSKNPDYESLLRKIVTNRFEFVKKNIPLFKILIQEISFHQDIQQAFIQNFKEKVYPRFEELIEKYQNNGEITNELETATVLRLSMTTIIGFIIARFIIIPEQDWDDDYEIEQTIQFIRKGLK